ncbi:MAG: universal stress protein [Deltaproteobacteria bacterium]|nr:universal stress protein [Deltaproteobacteria bacterium]
MYKRMMVPLDGSELAECVIPHVEAFLKAFSLSDVILACVVEPVIFPHRDEYFDPRKLAEQEAVRKSSAKDYLEKVMKRLPNVGTALRAEVLAGRVTESLIDCAEQNQIDLIVIATHGRSGVTRWVRGSVADRILRAAHVPVFMIRAPGTKGGI